MKILAIGDLHGDVLKARKLAEKADKENVDLVVLSGDITHHEHSIDNLVGPFAKLNKRVLLIPGNHETLATANTLAKIYGATNLHGYSYKLKDIGLFGCGSANIGLFQLTEDEIYDTLKKGFDRIKDSEKKIMVTHVHPAESKMEKMTSFFEGSKGVTKAIKKLQPDLLLCSHVHEAEGIEEKIGKTRVINVGREGRIIEI